MMRLPVIDVAVNIVRAPDGRVLMAERTARQLAAGFWELPGGKIDPGETPGDAAARELNEEIGIQPRALRRGISYEHAFPTKRIRLHVFHVQGFDGVPHGREGQRVAWVDPASLSVAPVLPSIQRVLAILALPQLAVQVRISDHSSTLGLLQHIRDITAAGPRLLVLNGAGLVPEQAIALARRVTLNAQHSETPVLLTGTAMDAHRAGAHGAIFRATDLPSYPARAHGKISAVQCHTEADVARAEAWGADMIFLSPILVARNATHAGLGWAGLQRVAAATTIPVFAAGGFTTLLLDHALAAGAAGILLDLNETFAGGAGLNPP